MLEGGIQVIMPGFLGARWMPGTPSNEHSQAVPPPEPFFWPLISVALGGGEGDARASHGPERTQHTPPTLALAFQGHGQSFMWMMRCCFQAQASFPF